VGAARHDPAAPASFVIISGVVEWNDVRVLQPGCHEDLAQKTFSADLRTRFGGEDFHGDLTMMSLILSQVYRGHTAPRDLPLDKKTLTKHCWRHHFQKGREPTNRSRVENRIGPLALLDRVA
jgi:hypothetical protein